MAVVEQRIPMSYQEWVDLGDDVPGEYLDGFHVMVPPPTKVHQLACFTLDLLLRAAAPPGHEVVQAWGWHLADDFEAFPDVMVVPPNEENARFHGVPALVVEVLSTNRSNDLVRKRLRYAQAGLPFYWIVDLGVPVVTALRLVGERFEEVARAEGDVPVELPFAGGSARVVASAL